MTDMLRVVSGGECAPMLCPVLGGRGRPLPSSAELLNRVRAIFESLTSKTTHAARGRGVDRELCCSKFVQFARTAGLHTLVPATEVQLVFQRAIGRQPEPSEVRHRSTQIVRRQSSALSAHPSPVGERPREYCMRFEAFARSLSEIADIGFAGLCGPHLPTISPRAARLRMLLDHVATYVPPRPPPPPKADQTGKKGTEAPSSAPPLSSQLDGWYGGPRKAQSPRAVHLRPALRGSYHAESHPVTSPRSDLPAAACGHNQGVLSSQKPQCLLSRRPAFGVRSRAKTGLNWRAPHPRPESATADLAAARQKTKQPTSATQYRAAPYGVRVAHFAGESRRSVPAHRDRSVPVLSAYSPQRPWTAAQLTGSGPLSSLPSAWDVAEQQLHPRMSQYSTLARNKLSRS
jgi:hypothetical protein